MVHFVTNLDNSPFCAKDTIPAGINNLEIESKNLLSWIQYNGLKANPDKFHLLLSEKDYTLKMNVGGFDIENSQTEKLLGITVDNKMTFNPHVTNLCSKASQKLHALARVGNYMDLKQRKLIVNTFILSQFGYCPLVWMFHNRTLNNRINRIHERALRIIYQDKNSSFDELLTTDNSYTIHHRNIQTVCIELYKVAYGVAPKIMRLVFPTKPTVQYPWENIFQTNNIRTVTWGSESLSYLGPKLWSLLPLHLKKLPTLKRFKPAIRRWRPDNCPCRLCKYYLAGVGFINVVN